MHEGAWIAGSKEGVANYLKMLAGKGYATVGVECSTGYGSRYPTPVRQVNAALEYLQEHADELGIDPDRIVLAGDSAGAQIAAQIGLLTTDRTDPDNPEEFADWLHLAAKGAKDLFHGSHMARIAFGRRREGGKPDAPAAGGRRPQSHRG